MHADSVGVQFTDRYRAVVIREDPPRDRICEPGDGRGLSQRTILNPGFRAHDLDANPFDVRGRREGQSGLAVPRKRPGK